MTMPRRFDLGRAVLVAGSALLLISLFLDWYDTGQTGWQVFEALDLVLAALAVAGMVAALRPDLVPPWSAWAVPLAAVVIVALQLIDNPPAASPDADPDAGAWVALGGALLMAAGSSLSLTSISVTVSVADRDVRRRMAAVDRRDALAAEDLDADAGLDEPVPPSTAPDARPAPEVPPAPRHSRAGSGDIERTQPLSALDEPAEGTERP
jgi:hypothetical protein